MENIGTTVTITKSEYRTCVVKGRNVLFHTWEEKSSIVEPSKMMGGHDGGVIRTTVGIIEYEDGIVTECYPYEIRFTDNKFKDYHFKEEDEKNE